MTDCDSSDQLKYRHQSEEVKSKDNVPPSATQLGQLLQLLQQSGARAGSQDERGGQDTLRSGLDITLNLSR